MAVHPQTSGQVEQLNKTIIARLRHYLTEHQRDWDINVQPLTYACNAQMSCSTNLTPLSLVLSRQPI